MKGIKWDKGDGNSDNPPRCDEPGTTPCTQDAWQKGEKVLIHDADPGSLSCPIFPLRWDITTSVRQPDHVSKESLSCPFLTHGSGHQVQTAAGLGNLISASQSKPTEKKHLRNMQDWEAS